MDREESGAGLPFLSLPPPRNLNTYQPQHTNAQLLRCLESNFQGQEKEGSAGMGCRWGEREELARGAELRRRAEGSAAGMEGGGRRWGADARTAGGGIGPLPHLAALLVMKADHHDVQDGSPRGAIAAPPGLLHDSRRGPARRRLQPPRAAGRATPRSPGGRRSADFRCQPGRRMSAAQGAWRRPRLLQLRPAPRGRRRASRIRLGGFRAVT